jgi:hypothetical protein
MKVDLPAPGGPDNPMRKELISWERRLCSTFVMSFRASCAFILLVDSTNVIALKGKRKQMNLIMNNIIFELRTLLKLDDFLVSAHCKDLRFSVTKNDHCWHDKAYLPQLF